MAEHLLTCSHTVKSLQLQYHTVHTHGPERVDPRRSHTLSRPRCRLRHCLAAAVSLWNSKVVDPRQSSQCFSPTGLEFLPGGIWDICCLSLCRPTLPAPLASLHRRFTPPHCTHRRTRRLDTNHLHTPTRVNNADHLRTLSSGVGDAVDRHNCGLVVGPSSDGRCHRGLGGGIPLQDSDRAEVSCRSLCKQRRPGP